MAKTPLSIAVHDHFRKANILHGYVQEHLGEARNHALEIGQELLAAKKAIPHGGWEDECDRLFDGNSRTARFYMLFAKDMGALPKTASVAVLMVEGTLTGAAKAARVAVNPPKPKKPPASPPKPPPTDLPGKSPGAPEAPVTDAQRPGTGKCPNCQKTKWEEDEDGFSCVKCRHPWGVEAGDVDDNQFKRKQQKAGGSKGKLPKQYDRSALLKTWTQSIGPLIRQVTRIADGVGEKHGKYHKAVRVHLDKATDIMEEWLGEKR